MRLLGFNHSTPKLKFLIVLTQEERHHLSLRLLELRPVFNRNMRNLFLTGELKVEPCQMVLKRALASFEPISTLSLPAWVPCALGSPAPLAHSPANLQRASSFLRIFRIACPQCSIQRQFHGQPFKNRIWTSIRCQQCSTTFLSHRWLCPCGVAWRCCNVHSRWADFAALHARSSLKHRCWARRSRHDASDSASLLKQVHETRALQTFSSGPGSLLQSGHGCTNDITHSNNTCIIHFSTPMPTPRKRPASENLGFLRKCPKLFARFGHLATG